MTKDTRGTRGTTGTKGKRPSSPSDTPDTRIAKAAAHETIGKLIGDDAAVRTGRDEQRRAQGAKGAAHDVTSQQEQE